MWVCMCGEQYPDDTPRYEVEVKGDKFYICNTRCLVVWEELEKRQEVIRKLYNWKHIIP